MDRFPWRFGRRLVLLQAVLVLLALASAGLAARHYFKKEYVAQSTAQLREALLIASRGVPSARVPRNWCDSRSEGTRIMLTLTDAQGQVLCDSRGSATLSEKMLYAGSQVGGMVLRGAMPLADVEKALGVFDASLALVLIVVAVALMAFAFGVGRALVHGEWSEVETSLSDLRKDLQSKTESLKLERQELSTLIGAISDAVLAVDRAGVPLFLNERFEVVFGELGFARKGARLWEIFRDPDVLAAFRAAIDEGEVASAKTAMFGRGDAPGRCFSLSVAPLRSGGGVYGAVGIFHDVTELKAAERMRIDFVANVSHELRTPLTSIKGYTDTLLGDLAEGRAVEPSFAEAIARNVERLLELIDDLLDLSSLESSIGPEEGLQKARLSTAEATARALDRLGKRFNAKQQKITIVNEVACVAADPRRLEQVLVNLLDNAHKYVPVGGSIQVVWRAEATGARTILEVADDGPGISPEHHARLFERFYRVDKARSREKGGTGLGLAIVKHIMQSHGGSVSIESRVGEGARFVCSFPGDLV